jgi:AcrR family transcriptional regulator
MHRVSFRASSFVAHDEREQLMAIYAAVVYERGYAATRLTEVAQRADVPLAVVTDHWPTEVDWLLETAATATHQLFVHAADTFMGIDDDAPRAVHVALDTMLRDLAAAPEMTYLSIVALPSLGPLVCEHRVRALELFCTLLRPAFAARDDGPPDPEAVSLCIAGGLWELIRRHALQRSLHELPDALPAVSHVCLSTCFGVEEALRVNRSDSATPSRGAGT